MPEDVQKEQSHENFFAFAAETAKAVRESLAEPLDKAMAPLMRDGTLAAAWRQGADEIAQALKAFPDSVAQHHEPGSINNPLYSDIARARESYAADPPTPSELIDRPRTQEPMQQENSNDMHLDQGRGGHSL